MRRFAGACRFVFNRALALQNENHEAGNKYIPYNKMASCIRRQLPWPVRVNYSGHLGLLLNCLLYCCF